MCKRDCILSAIYAAWTIASSCAHVPSPEAVAAPAMTLELGLNATCGSPASTYPGHMFLDKDLCMHSSNGTASCVYVGKIVLGGAMMCMIGVAQEKCGAEYTFQKMECIPWNPDFEVYVRKVQSQND